MCSNFEDCFRYIDSDKSIMAEVIGYGDMKEYDDEYYGYFNMYVAEFLKVVRLVTRDELINMAKMLPEERLVRFIQTFKMSDDETDKVLENSKGKVKVLKAVQYYHFGNKHIYEE